MKYNNVKFISDLHLGHSNMAMWRGFSSIEEHDQHIIKCWNEVVHKKDIVYVLGDVTRDQKKYFPLLNELKGKKFVVLGNHDRRQDIPDLLKYVDGVLGMGKFHGFFLTHAPIHPNELEYRNLIGNIHGHMHEKVIDDPRYINVSCEQVNYRPKTIHELYDGELYDPKTSRIQSHE
jgi:calcineurin-like phosphoesterase family protein